jgi:hypothetical protein
MSIAALERNRYFFGKMMDVAQFEKEQEYFRNHLALLSRLVIGTGVVCGLEVTADATTKGNVSISPGIAIDGLGRFVIVPSAASVNPSQLTDNTGQPQGSPQTTGATLLCLSYAETCADPVTVMISDCDAPGGCAASTIREGFVVLVSAAPKKPASPLTCPLTDFSKLSPADLQQALAKLIGSACSDPQSACVPLARIDLPGGAIDAASDRPIVFSNHLLMQLLMCLKPIA